MARTFARAGIPASRILVSQYPAPLYDEGAQWAEREPIAGLILFVGRLDREKGYAQLMQACAMVKAPHQLRLVGASELDGRESLRTPQAEGGNAEWVGAVTSRAELSAHFGQAAIVSVPSVWGDPSPLVRLEAMAHGRPVIAFDSGGVGSVIEHGKTGLLVPRMDVPALACAIDSLLTDPALARRMGRAARKKVEFEFSRERHVHDVVAFVQRLRLNNPRRV